MKNKDLSIGKSVLYQSLKAAGLLVNGRIKVGGKVADRKKKLNREACRGQQYQ